MTVEPRRRTSWRSRRPTISLATTALFFASFATHDAGETLHSVVSLVFTAVLVFHLRINWKLYRRSIGGLFSKPKFNGVLDSSQLVLAAVVTVTGLTWWLLGDDWELGHEFFGGVIMFTAFAHIYRHRASAWRLLKRLRPS